MRRKRVRLPAADCSRSPRPFSTATWRVRRRKGSAQRQQRRHFAAAEPFGGVHGVGVGGATGKREEDRRGDKEE